MSIPFVFYKKENTEKSLFYWIKPFMDSLGVELAIDMLIHQGIGEKEKAKEIERKIKHHDQGGRYFFDQDVGDQFDQERQETQKSGQNRREKMLEVEDRRILERTMKREFVNHALGKDEVRQRKKGQESEPIKETFRQKAVVPQKA